MSYSHTQRRKAIQRFKKQFGKKWYSKFLEYVDRVVMERLT